MRKSRIVVTAIFGGTAKANARDNIYQPCPVGTCKQINQSNLLISDKCSHCDSTLTLRFNCSRCGAVYYYCNNEHLQ